jgi:hypothetical protein
VPSDIHPSLSLLPCFHKYTGQSGGQAGENLLTLTYTFPHKRESICPSQVTWIGPSAVPYEEIVSKSLPVWLNLGS